MRADIRLVASANGLWSAAPAPAENKRKARAVERLVREGHVEVVRTLLERTE